MLDDNEKQEALFKLVHEMRKFLIKYGEDSNTEKPELIINKLTGLTGYDIISMIQLLDLALKNLDKRTEVFLCPGEDEHCADFHYNIIDRTLEMFAEQILDILNNSGFNKLTARYTNGLIENACEYFNLEYDGIKQNMIDILKYCEQVFSNYDFEDSNTIKHLNMLHVYLTKEDI